jgi:hypothetical protein
MTEKPKLTFNVLVKPEEDQWSAHCLELDIVAVADTQDRAIRDLHDLIIAQWEYALKNDNLSHFFHPAPIECWNEYLQCELLNNIDEMTHHKRVEDAFSRGLWLVTTNARLCHA